MCVIHVARVTLCSVLHCKSLTGKWTLVVFWVLWVLWDLWELVLWWKYLVLWWNYIRNYCACVVFWAVWLLWRLWLFQWCQLKIKTTIQKTKHLSYQRPECNQCSECYVVVCFTIAKNYCKVNTRSIMSVVSVMSVVFVEKIYHMVVCMFSIVSEQCECYDCCECFNVIRLK